MNMKVIRDSIENAINMLDSLSTQLQPMMEALNKCYGEEKNFQNLLSINDNFSDHKLEEIAKDGESLNQYINDISNNIIEYKRMHKEFTERPLVVTLCGSKKKKKMIHTISELLINRNILCFKPNFSSTFDYTDPSILSFIHESHYWKMDHSDYIIIVDQQFHSPTDPYVGTDTQREIDYANMKHQKVIRISNLHCDDNFNDLINKLMEIFKEDENIKKWAKFI